MAYFNGLKSVVTILTEHIVLHSTAKTPKVDGYDEDNSQGCQPWAVYPPVRKPKRSDNLKCIPIAWTIVTKKIKVYLGIRSCIRKVFRHIQLPGIRISAIDNKRHLHSLSRKYFSNTIVINYLIPGIGDGFHGPLNETLEGISIKWNGTMIQNIVCSVQRQVTFTASFIINN